MKGVEEDQVAVLDAQFVVHVAPSWVLGYRSCLAVGVGWGVAFGAEQRDGTSGDLAEMSSVVAAAGLGAEGVARMEMERLVEEA